ncbi:MAG: ClpXP protease specificity-enhancing factor SspB [Myxococcota bacterium]
MTERKEATKKDQVLGCLEKGMTQIHLDARRPGVLVPERFRTEHHLVLNISYRFDPPDLAVSDWGIRQTLSFGGSRFTVAVPWSALYAVASLTTREFFMFPDDMPAELADAATEKAQLPPAPEADEKKGRAVLREVVIERAAGEEEPPKEPTAPPKRGHLRIVK